MDCSDEELIDADDQRVCVLARFYRKDTGRATKGCFLGPISIDQALHLKVFCGCCILHYCTLRILEDPPKKEGF